MASSNPVNFTQRAARKIKATVEGESRRSADLTGEPLRVRRHAKPDRTIRVYVGEAIAVTADYVTYDGWSDRNGAGSDAPDFYGIPVGGIPPGTPDCIVYDQNQPGWHNNFTFPGTTDPLPLRGLVIGGTWRGQEESDASLKRVFINATPIAWRSNMASTPPRVEMAYVRNPEDPFHWVEWLPGKQGCI